MSQPIFAKPRSLGDKLVEYIVGDGPSYRYALICKYCREHNGLALQEEFPYMCKYMFALLNLVTYQAHTIKAQTT